MKTVSALRQIMLLSVFAFITGCDSHDGLQSPETELENPGKSSIQQEGIANQQALDDNKSPNLLLFLNELLIKIIDGEDEFVEGITIYAHDGTTLLYGNSIDTDFQNSDANWAAEVTGEGEQQEYMIILEPQVDYILYTDPEYSNNQMWYRFESEDTFIKLNIDGEPEFELIENIATSVIEFITASILEVNLGTPPYTTGVQSEIEWEVDWVGSSSAPDIFPTTAKIELITASGSTTLSSSETHLTGEGSYLWTPQQVYTNAKIRVTDNNSGAFAESSIFNVENSVILDADITGSSVVEPNIEHEWFSDVEGGAIPYTYLWEYMPICEESLLLSPTCDEWHFGGTSSSFEWTFVVEGEVTIRLTVTDDQDEEDVATKGITVADF